jgi:pSer/pThr/pTyr-binding forkhead associated (FHA) protein
MAKSRTTWILDPGSNTDTWVDNYMEKLVVMGDDESPLEFPLVGKRMLIGRDESCDISLKDRSVSRHHATLLKVFGGYSIEDEKSTNGTRVNGNAVTKRFLKHGDLIEVGKYHLRFITQKPQHEMDDPDRTVVLNRSEINPPASAAPRVMDTPAARIASAPRQDAASPPPEANLQEGSGAVVQGQPRVRFLSGANNGEVKLIDRAFFSVGSPSGDLVLINQRHSGYYLLKVGGDKPPMLNGEPIKAGGVELKNGDRIELGELLLEFLN